MKFSLSDTFLRKHFAYMLRHRVLIILLYTLLLPPAFYGITHIRLNSSTENFIVQNDPNLKAYNDFKKTFGPDESLLILLPALFDGSESFKQQRDLIEKLLQREEVDEVLSVFSLYDRLLTNNKQKIKKLEQAVAEKKQNLINALIDIPKEKKRKGTIGLVLLVKITNPNQRTNLYNSTLSLLQKEGFRLNEVTIAGGPALNHLLGETPRKDALIFFPLLGLLSAILLLAIFRHYAPLLLSFLIIGETLALSLGLLGLSGGSFTILSNILPAVLYIVSLAALIHLIHPLMKLAEQEKPKTPAQHRDACIAIFSDKFRPCLFSAFTTASGFLSLTVSEVEPVQELGLFLAMGVFISFLLLTTLLPALASFLIPQGLKRRNFFIGANLKGRKLTPYLKKHRLLLSFFPLFILALSISAIPAIPFQTNGLLYFSPESAIRAGNERIEALGIATRTIELKLSAKEPLFQKEENITQLALLEEKLLQLPEVLQVHSIANSLKEANKRMFSIDAIPGEESFEAFYSSIDKQSPFFVESFLTKDRSKARIMIGITDMEYEEFAQLQQKIEAIIASSSLSKSCNISITGGYRLIMNIQHYLVETLSGSIFISFLVVSVCFLLLFQKGSVALIALLPNLYPVFATLLFLYLASMSFDIANIMIGGIILGIVVDSTAHFLYRYKTEQNKGLKMDEAIAKTLDTSGKAIFLSGIILSAGFAVLSFSHFIPTAHFGMLSSFALLNGIIGDLVFLPALLFLFEKNRKETEEKQ